jgi:hypothetical protein
MLTQTGSPQQAIAQRFSALARSGGSLRRNIMSEIEG